MPEILRPLSLEGTGSGRDMPDEAATPRRQEDQPGAAVAGISMTLQIPGAFKMTNQVVDGLTAHAGARCQRRGPLPIRSRVLQDRQVLSSNVMKLAARQRLVNMVTCFLPENSHQWRDERRLGGFWA